MRKGIATPAALALLASLAAVSGAAAQRGGGGGGGGGFGGGGGAPPQQDNGPNLPTQEDFTGPISIDSLNKILKLDSNEVTALTLRREAFMQLTASLRDSLGRAAVVMGYAHATKPSTDPAGDLALARMYDKLLERVRKQDSDFYDKQVKPQLTKAQQKLLLKWYQTG